MANFALPAGGAVVLPPSDPPLLHELKASKSVAQAITLLSDWFDISIGYV
jgi:hypothetical protein